MTGYVTDKQYARCANVPLSAAQTELRAAKTLMLASVTLAHGERLELRGLTLSLISVLNPAITPKYLNSDLGLCSVGIYNTTMISSPLAYTLSHGNTTITNPFSNCVIATPGVYQVILSNNTSNVDLSVAATGSLKHYY